MCNENCPALKDFIRMYPLPLYAVIDDDYKPTKEVRTSCHKATASGCEIRKIDLITDQLFSDMIDIYSSTPQRQHRDINYLYHLPEGGSWDLREGWPHPDYSVFTCSKHYFDMWGCFIDNKMVAFLELLHSNELASTYATMGHADYLNKGIMKFMFSEVIKMSTFKYLHYGDKEKNAMMKFFLSDLGITNCDPQFIYSISEK